MSDVSLRVAYTRWPLVNQRLREAAGSLTDEELILKPADDRWPMWATIGHLACQRVFWLCVFAGEPGADTTPFTNSGYDCPGDDDLENVLSAQQLVAALDSTFAIVEGVLDRWTVATLDEVLRRPEWDGSWLHSRASVVQRLFAHDVWHAAELNDTLSRNGLPVIDIWDW